MADAVAARTVTMPGAENMKRAPTTSKRGPITVQMPTSVSSLRSEVVTVGDYWRRKAHADDLWMLVGAARGR